MLHAFGTVPYIALWAHPLPRQLGLLRVAHAVIVICFRQFFPVKLFRDEVSLVSALLLGRTLVQYARSTCELYTYTSTMDSTDCFLE